ncbi:DUF1223 domain-containing protein [Chitinophaga flava]|uniref:DUF1223 domain-containing protein n=1 Tax=Chitinophaga flava TaxID=2259036 RepID=A0A365XV73_9BACT|nr:DUF1223 domain-containing protein [Chitinophaga flava]RBL90267.1 DUF1223 domain-containing protein [Chitinophaga flava]
MKSLIISAISMCLISLSASCSGPLINTTDSTKGFAVVELFTSEGCSSCPPADALLSRLEQESNGKPVYLLAFHVDYWDHQGWRDSYSQHSFSERQQQYAAWLKRPNIYTPQMVINGSSEFVGSNVAAVKYAINESLNQPASTNLLLQTKLESQQLEVSWQLLPQPKNTRLLLAFVQKNGQSQVRAGENAGRKLSHVQIVQQLTSVDPGRNVRTSLSLPAGFNMQDWELIGFVQRDTDGQIIAAAKATLK